MISLRREMGRVEEGLQEGERTEASMALQRAVEMGKRYLSKGDAEFLERVLTGEVPEVDWKKLNRKAVFKMKYKARSGKIQKILADMLQTFEDNLKDAEKNEASSLSTFEKLDEQRKSQLGAAQDALTAGAAEAGARGQSVDESQEEVDSLTAQVKADEGYIAAAEDSYATMKDQWKERKRLRSEEIASIEKAIAILSSDEARDVMSSSFKSQGNLLQENTEVMKKRARAASKQIRELAKKHKDFRLAALAVSISFGARTGGRFDSVVKGIDGILSDLHKENDMDLKVKEDCENDRNKNTKMAKNAAYDIDEQTAIIVRQKAAIETKEAEIARLQQEKKDTMLQRDEATVTRNKEAKEYAAAKADDEAAAGLIEKAKGVLEKFYSDNQLALLTAGQPVVVAGEAPPPPPTTWSEPYRGAK